MNQEVARKILQIQETVRSDLDLMAEHQSKQEAFLALLSDLSQDQQDVLLDYLGVGIEIHLRMLEICLETE
ncbi:MAG: hypothetical protein IJX69_00025 [Oscillospiraceae bacterium]|nr:hypothetical protein [Oscillospiraceae bacterium]